MLSRKWRVEEGEGGRKGGRRELRLLALRSLPSPWPLSMTPGWTVVVVHTTAGSQDSCRETRAHTHTQTHTRTHTHTHTHAHKHTHAHTHTHTHTHIWRLHTPSLL